MNIKLAINGNKDSLDIVKLCILYFDNVTVEIPCYFDTDISNNSLTIKLNPLLCSNITDQLFYLAKENIISIDRVEISKKRSEIQNKQIAEYIHHISGKIILKSISDIYDNIVFTNNSLSFEQKTTIKSEELKDIIDNIPLKEQKSLLKKFLNNNKMDQENMYKCFYCFYLLENLISNIFYNLYNGVVSVSNSNLINSMLYKYHNNQCMSEMFKKSINMNCASILLPNLSNTTYDEILELKYKAKDELIELRNYIENLNVNYDAENVDNINDIIINKINPSIRNFEYKIKDIKINVAQKFITEIKNPFSYVPLIGTIFADVPQYISLMLSVALIGTDVGLEYIKQLNNIKKDNMYFLFKLHKMI